MAKCIPVTFQKPKSEDRPYTLNCEIVPGQVANEIIIKAILPDDRDIEKCIKIYVTDSMSNAGCKKRAINEEVGNRIKEFRHHDQFGIPVLFDETCAGLALPATALLTRKKIKAVTVFESWRDPSKILKTTPYMTSAGAWLGYMGGTPVSIELTDGTTLHGQIEPRLKEERKKIIEHENTQKVSKAEAKYQKILPDARRGRKVIEAASQGGNERARQEYEPTRKQYQAALVEYMKENKYVSLTAAREKIAARFKISRRTVERNTRALFKK